MNECEKKSLHLGDYGEEYEEFLDPLKKAIQSFSNGYFPSYLPDDVLESLLLDNYIVKFKVEERPKGSVYRMIVRLRGKELLAWPRKAYDAKLLFIPDGCTYKRFMWFITDEYSYRIRDGNEKKKILNELFKNWEKDDNPQGLPRYHRSIIGLLNSDTGYNIFSFPRIIDADYAFIFKEIFTLKEEGNRQDVIEKNRSSTVKVEGHYFYRIEEGAFKFNFKKYKDEKDIDRIYHCIHFLLDFIFGYLASDCGITEIPKEREESFNKEEFEKLKMKISYSPNPDIEKAAVNRVFNSATQNTAERAQLLSILQTLITDFSSNPEQLTIPYFYIYLPRMLELYSYAILKKGYPNLAFKPDINGNTPDMLLSLEKNIIFLDAKFKPDYIIPSRLEQSDEEQMEKYIEKKGDYCLIIYPNMACEDIIKAVKNAIDNHEGEDYKMVGFSLPVK